MGRGGGGAYRAAAWAQMKDPVVLMSRVRFHAAISMLTACSHPTTPAKQHRMFILPNRAAASTVAFCTFSASVTSTFRAVILACGKSWVKESISAPA